MDTAPIAGVKLSSAAGVDASSVSSHELIAERDRDWKPGTYAHWRLIHPAFHPSTGFDYQLWCVLPEGARHASVAGLARLLGRHPKTVSRALAKLKAAGLASGQGQTGWRSQSDRRLMEHVAREHEVYSKIAAQIERDRIDHVTRPSEQQIEDRRDEREQRVAKDLADATSADTGFDLAAFEDRIGEVWDAQGNQPPSEAVYAQVAAALDTPRPPAKTYTAPDDLTDAQWAAMTDDM